MLKSTCSLLIVIIGAIMLSACAGSSLADNPKTVVITPAIKGNSVSLGVGDTLELQIPTIPTAGYSWIPQNLDTSILTPAGEAEYTASSDPNSAGGISTLKFTAVGKGTTTLNLLYESTMLSSDSISVVVEVK